MNLTPIAYVLFLCRGNMERSQMAEAFYNHITRSNHATSAGVIDVSGAYPNPPNSTIQVMKAIGIDISKQRVKQLKPWMLRGIDRIYVFCEPDTCPSFLKLVSIPIVYHHIDDPYRQPVEKVIEIRDTIHQFVRSILEA